MPDEPHAPALMSQATMARAEMLSYKPGGRSSGARPNLNTAKVEEKAAAGAAASGKSARGAGSTRATPRSKISTAGGGASGTSPHAAGTSSRASPRHGDQAQKSKSKRAKLSSRKAATTAASSTTSGGGDGGAGRGDDHTLPELVYASSPTAPELADEVARQRREVERLEGLPSRDSGFG